MAKRRAASTILFSEENKIRKKEEKDKLWTVQLRHRYMNIPTKFP